MEDVFTLDVDMLTTSTCAHNLDELGNSKEDSDDSKEYGIGVQKWSEQVITKVGGAPWSTERVIAISSARHIFHSTWPWFAS